MRAEMEPTSLLNAAALRWPFNFALRTEIVFGTGSIRQLGELVRRHDGQRVLLVTDPGIVRAGHVPRAEAILKAAGLDVHVFDGVVENPTTRTVQDCLVVANAAKIDFLVGLGGGSSLDTAKGCNFLLTNGGSMEDYWGVGKAARPMLPLVAVPTTAGTGSECQSFAIIAQERTHRKMACGDPKASPRVALLDPELTLTQPESVTLACGIDAIAHALESAVSRKASPLSQLFSREAFRLAAHALRRVLEEPGNLEARGAQLLGASLAGMAIENSMLGAAHAAANPLTARLGLVHGLAVGLMLPEVVRFNSEDAFSSQIYEDLAMAAGLAADESRIDAAERIVEFLESFDIAEQARRQAARSSVQSADLPTLAAEAAQQWTANFNPREVGPAEFRDFYQSVLPLEPA